MTNEYNIEEKHSCLNCIHFTQPPCEIAGLKIGDCVHRLRYWYPQRGYGPCMQWWKIPGSPLNFGKGFDFRFNL